MRAIFLPSSVEFQSLRAVQPAVQKEIGHSLRLRGSAQLGVRVESTIRKVQIDALKAELEASLVRCNSLAWDLDTAASSEDEIAIARLWERTEREHEAIKSALALLEQRDREEQEDANPDMLRELRRRSGNPNNN